ncbi:hypothetical protein C4579_02045 [Candidatus Microgenomates bacterium]|nr:MAG: hypothetical protein C4579_02045 [Candidatus Microgenomates bacterium]
MSRPEELPKPTHEDFNPINWFSIFISNLELQSGYLLTARSETFFPDQHAREALTHAREAYDHTRAITVQSLELAQILRNHERDFGIILVGSPLSENQLNLLTQGVAVIQTEAENDQNTRALRQLMVARALKAEVNTLIDLEIARAQARHYGINPNKEDNQYAIDLLNQRLAQTNYPDQKNSPDSKHVVVFQSPAPDYSSKIHVADFEPAPETLEARSWLEIANQFGITRANWYDSYGQTLLAGGIPFDFVDMVFRKIRDAFDYYDGSLPFPWSENYTQKYQPSDDSPYTHPDNE